MGLRGIIASLLGAGAVPACNRDVPKNVEQPAEVAGSYAVVSVEELLREEDKDSLLELYVEPKRRNDYDESSEILGWNYAAGHVGGMHETHIGYCSLPALIKSVRDELVGTEGPFSAVLLHTYRLSEQQRDELARGLGIGRVAYVKTQPPAKPSPSGVWRIDGAGVDIISGGGSRGTVMTI